MTTMMDNLPVEVRINGALPSPTLCSYLTTQLFCLMSIPGRMTLLEEIRLTTISAIDTAPDCGSLPTK